MVAYAAVGGAFAGFCWLPFGLAPLLPLAFLIALRGLRLVASSRDALLFGLVCGAFRHAVGGHYIVTLVTYSPLAILIYLLDISYVLPFAAMESWGAYAIERRTGIDRAIPFALLYTVLEWTRTVGDLSVPSDLLSHAFGTDPSWLAWSPVAGPHALTLVTIAVAILIDRAIERRSDRRKAAVLATLACALWLAPPATDLVARRTDRPALKPLRIGIVQPSVTIQQKLDRTRWPEMWDILKPLTREAARGADLVVWPESSRPGPLIWKDEKPFSDPEMEALAREVGVPILYGCELARFTSGQVTALYNAAALARPDGTAGDWYGKQQLLPFVEGIPFARLIGWDPATARREPGGKRSALTLIGNFVPGDRPTIFEVGPARLGVLICYEGLYPRLVRRYRNAGANALVVMTNDAWWGHTVFARWHARMIATRAREADLPVVRAANSGVSSVTDRRGTMGPSTGLFEVRTLQVDLSPSTTAPTPYARSGDVVVAAAAIGLLALLGFGRRRGKRPPI
jgi:apolipoprotein N-acyltransferase